MLLQCFTVGIGKILRVILAGPGRFRRSAHRTVVPIRIVDRVGLWLGLRFLAFAGFARLRRWAAFEGLLERGVSRLASAAVLLGLQHDVALERLANLCLQLQHW